MGTPGAQPLPAELIHQILEQLAQKDLWLVAEASRQFYAYALEAGLYVHRQVHWGYMQHGGFSDSLDKLELVLEHVASNRPALNISIHAVLMRSRHTTTTEWDESMQTFAAALQRTLPNLVRLHFSFLGPRSDEVLAMPALCTSPAPKLRSLTVSHDTDSAFLIPLDLFNGQAPQLRKVSLCLPNIQSMSGSEAIAAFHSVTHLRLEVRLLAQCLILAPIFPALRVLVIDNMGSYSTGVIDVRGLTLPYLAMWGPITTLTNTSPASLSDIGIIELYELAYSADDAPPDPSWQPRCDALCGVVECRQGQASISVGPRDGAWRCTITQPSLPSELSLALVGNPTLATNLASLSVHYALFDAFARAAIKLDALRELFIDVVNSPNTFCEPRADFLHHEVLEPEVAQVRCPALSRAVLFAGPGTTPAVVSARRVVQLASALGLRGRQAALTLSGCIWAASCDTTDGAKVADLFSAVEQTRGTLPEYYDTCRYSGYFDRWVTEWD